MSILKFKPILKSILWGGEKIVEYKQIDSDLKMVGESWEISGVKGDESVVVSGEFSGMTLPELLSKMKGSLVGRANYERFGDEFPLLIKFIDAKQPLSIQVHPNDKLSLERHNKKGKTEMWYVVDADAEAKLRVGFSQEITPSQYEEHIKNDTITTVLREYEIASGDLFFLPAGRIHSIGAGAFIAEIQQTSDVTYRIYDFNRKDADGNGRELHTELSKDAIDYNILADYRTDYNRVKNCGVELASCEYFTTFLYDLDEPIRCDYSQIDSFVVVMCLEGEGFVVSDDGERVAVARGETVLLPATTKWLDIKPTFEMKILTSYI